MAVQEESPLRKAGVVVEDELQVSARWPHRWEEGGISRGATCHETVE